MPGLQPASSPTSAFFTSHDGSGDAMRPHWHSAAAGGQQPVQQQHFSTSHPALLPHLLHQAAPSLAHSGGSLLQPQHHAQPSHQQPQQAAHPASPSRHSAAPDAASLSSLPLEFNPYHPYYAQFNQLPHLSPLALSPMSALLSPPSALSQQQLLHSLAGVDPRAALPLMPLFMQGGAPGAGGAASGGGSAAGAAGASGSGRLVNPSFCKFYAAGHCTRGDQCNYAHVRPDASSALLLQQAAAASARGSFRARGRGDARQGRDGGRGRSSAGTMRGGFRDQRLQDERLLSQLLQYQQDSPLLQPKDAGQQPLQLVHGSNPLSPLSPSLLGLSPLADPSLLLSPASFSPLDFPLPYSPYLPPEYSLEPPATLGVGLSASADELSGRVYSLAKDQYGCRLLQRLLDEQRAGVLERVYAESFPHVSELMTDPFGNYLCQKLLEQCGSAQRLSVLQAVSADLVPISLNLHGTRAVQKLVETLSSAAETEALVAALSGSVVLLVKDQNGNHVVQRALHHLSPRDNQFIFDSVSRHCVAVATHKHGCCVLQRCIDYATAAQRRQLIAEICNHALELVQDAFGKSAAAATARAAAHCPPPASASHCPSLLAAVLSAMWCSTCWT